MKQFLHNFAKMSCYKRRNFLITVLLSMFTNFATAQTSGIYESYAILSINGASNSYYDMQATTTNHDFNGANLGSFVYGLETLVFKGGQNKTYKNGGCNINSSAINYRIYVSGSPTGSYSNVNESFLSNDGGGGNQTWEGLTGSANLIAGLSPGIYTIEVYSQAGYDGCGTGTHYSSNGGSNYKATFTVVKAESSISVTGATSFTYNASAQGPSTSVVTGSTGLVSYSYEGVSGTIYSASPTPPTNVGTYTVTATVASDTNYNGASSTAYSFTIEPSTYIPDTYFEQALIGLGYDSGAIDHYVLTSAISGVTDLDVSNKSITDLTGIQGFSSLYGLICEDNLLTSLDVSALPNLRNLSMLGNQLVNASDLKAHPNLTYLDCDDNLFTSINVSALTNLTDLYCSGNKLTNLDVRGLANLQYFECTNNPSLSCILVDDVVAANTATTTISPENYPSQPYYYAKDATAKYSYCNCNMITTTWNGTSWDNGAPTDDTYEAIIAFDYSEATNLNACSLTIKSNANVLIPSGTKVTLNAPITVATGSTFVLNNNANLIQTNKNSINSGNINVKRNSNPLYRLDYTLWSSPVTGAQTLANFSPLTSQSPNRFYIYDNTLGANGLYASVPPATAFSPGTGYLIRMPNEDPANLGTSTPYYLGNSTLTYNGVFTGVPNNGTITLGISTPLVSDEYYAIGNPYPSTISANAFLAGNTTEGTLYFWRKTNMVANSTGSAYATWTTLGAAASNVAPNDIVPNGTIQVGQGFIVKTGTAATTLVFTNSMRTSNNDNQFFKTKQVAQKDRVWLNLTATNGVFSQTLIGYVDGATVGVDNGIDGKYINDSPIALTSNINNEEYTIQGRPTFDVSDVVALNFKTDVAGDYTIAIDHADGLFTSGQAIYLVDSKTGTETNLKTSSYNFTAASGVDNTRFSLKYQKTLKVDAPVFNENSVTVFKNSGVIYVNSKESIINNIKVYDVQGRLLAEQNDVKANTATINNLKATQQILIVKVTSEENKVISKKVAN